MICKPTNCFFYYYKIPFSYQILAPGPMGLEKDGKKCAEICLNSTQLDPELYRLGHTKARQKNLSQIPKLFEINPPTGTMNVPFDSKQTI